MYKETTYKSRVDSKIDDFYFIIFTQLLCLIIDSVNLVTESTPTFKMSQELGPLVSVVYLGKSIWRLLYVLVNINGWSMSSCVKVHEGVILSGLLNILLGQLYLYVVILYKESLTKRQDETSASTQSIIVDADKKKEKL
ncbi:hypothetical protein G6F57_009698 [Rhizopus arrhizus]|nr:hypothetical protein G6F30_010255 [Rhizopus arrhizus]KAG0983770.1 hypothetical protein G6F29_005271 [Rhizopus arrhizus]KAG0987374.1 hypothetical protein G6F28_010020 [Rhizopus arrhizus]KAG1004038.1 hypothetical protein G6F27_010504 [Rhizopus arrhizus]KAG1019245.1 hypothetical protein G6F26_010276 [Rhizopus arrhizus]